MPAVFASQQRTYKTVKGFVMLVPMSNDAMPAMAFEQQRKNVEVSLSKVRLCYACYDCITMLHLKSSEGS